MLEAMSAPEGFAGICDVTLSKNGNNQSKEREED